MTARSDGDGQAALYRAALDVLPDPIVIYDDTQVLYANDAACRLLGGAKEMQLQGRRVEAFVLPELAEVSTQRRAYVMEQGIELKNLIVKVRGLNGEPTVLRVDIRPISFESSTAAMATLARA